MDFFRTNAPETRRVRRSITLGNVRSVGGKPKVTSQLHVIHEQWRDKWARNLNVTCVD